MTIGSRHNQPDFETDRMPVADTTPEQHAAQVRLFGLTFSDVTLTEAAQTVVNRARTGPKLQIYFVNADCINIAARNEPYSRVLKNAGLLYADGAGMALAARICGLQLDNNVNGTDLFPLICEETAMHNVPIALLCSKRALPTPALHA